MRTRWERIVQPGGWGEIDRTHSLADRLVLALLPLGRTVRDAITGLIATPSGAALSSAVPNTAQPQDSGGSAIVLNNNAATGHIEFPVQGTLLSRMSGVVSIFCEAGPTAAGLNPHLFRDGESANGRGCGLAFDDISSQTNGVQLFVDLSTANPSNWDSLGTASSVRTHRLLLTADGAAAKVYTRGYLWETVTPFTATVTADAGRQTQVFANWAHTSTQGDRARFAVVLAWNRVLTLGEYQELYRNPWQLFKSGNRKILVSLAAAPGGVLVRAPSLMGGGMQSLDGGLRN